MLIKSKALLFGLISCELEYKALYYISTNNACVIANKRLQTYSTKGRVQWAECFVMVLTENNTDVNEVIQQVLA